MTHSLFLGLLMPLLGSFALSKENGKKRGIHMPLSHAWKIDPAVAGIRIMHLADIEGGISQIQGSIGMCVDGQHLPVDFVGVAQGLFLSIVLAARHHQKQSYSNGI